MSFRRRVNLRLLAWIVGVVVVLAIGITFLHGYQVRRNASILRNQAQLAEGQGQFEQAAKYYALYLGYVPRDLDAQMALGRAIDHKPDEAKTAGDWQVMYSVYQAVLREQPDHPDIRRRLVEILLRGERFREAAVHLTELLKTASSDSAELEQRLAWCLTRQGEYAKAQKEYDKALTLDPHLLAAYHQLATILLVQLKKPKDADKVIAKMIAENKSNPEAHVARAQYLSQRGGPAGEIDQELSEALRLAPENAEIIRLAAQSALNQGKTEDARKLLQRGVALAPKNADMYLGLADLELARHDPTAAIACLREGLKNTGGDVRGALRYKLGIALLQQGKVKETEEALAELRKESNIASVVIDELQARILVHEGEWAKAVPLLEAVRSRTAGQQGVSNEAELFLGYCYENLNQPDRALTAYRQALERTPTSIPAGLGLASAYTALGKLDDALAEYQRLLPREPAVAAKLAQLLILRNLRPDQKSNANWDLVNETLDKADPKSPEVVRLRAMALLQQGEPEKARSLLEDARKHDPDRLEIWLALAELEEVQKSGKTLAVLDQAQQRLGNRVELRFARASHWLRESSEDSSAALTELERDDGKLSAADRGHLIHGLAALYYRAGKTQEAKRLWTGLRDKDEKNLEARLALFNLAQQEGDAAAMEILVAEIRKLDGEEGLLWRYAQACRLLDQATKEKTAKERKPLLDKARVLLLQVAAQRPGWAAVLVRQAEASDLEGKQQIALEKYSQAIDLGERNPTVLRRAVDILYKNRRYAEARQLLSRVQDRSTTGDLLRMQAALAMENSDYENAIALARRPIAAGSKDPRDYIWLGQVLWAANKLEEAEQVLRQALAQRGGAQTPEAWVALVQLLAKTGHRDRAEAALREAERNLPQATASLALAQCYEALNRNDKALEQFNSAVAGKPNDAAALRNTAAFLMRQEQLAKAEPYLRKLLDPATVADEGDRIWARRGLALYLASTGDYGQFQTAMGYLDENQQKGSNLNDDLRTRAVVLSTRTEHRREAVRILEDLVRRQPPTVEEQLVLGELYEGIHQDQNARKAYAEAAAKAQEPKQLYLCGMRLLHLGETDRCQDCLAKLEKLEKDSPRTLQLRVLLLGARRRGDEAASLLKSYVQTPGANLELAAYLFEQVAQSGPAEELLRKIIAQSSDRDRKVLLLAAFLGRQGRPEEALDLCEQVWKGGKPEEAANVSLGVLAAANNPSEAQVRQIERLLEASLQTNPKSTALLLHRAALLNMERNYRDTEATYRRVLELDPANLVALNNLAWLIAVGDHRPDEASLLIERAIKLAGPQAELLDTRAVVQLENGSTTLAIQDLEKAISDAPAPGMYFHLALAQEKAGNHLGAVASLEKARSLKLSRGLLHPLEQEDFDRLVQLAKHK